MSITVTAAQSGTGGTDNGIALTVKVITGQAASPIGQTASSATVTAPELAITPTGNGSWVYGAVVNGGGATSFTAAGNTTFSQNVPDTTNALAYGTFRSSSTTTSGTPVTLGATAPAEASGQILIALLEILAGTGLAEDSSSPAGVNSKTATSVTTASFTPPGGSLLVAQVGSDANVDGTHSMTMTVTDSSGLTWTRRVTGTLTDGSATYQLASVWTAPVPVPPAAPYTLLAPPSPFSPMQFRRQARPTLGPVLVTDADTGSGADTAAASTAQAPSFPLIPPGPFTPMAFGFIPPNLVTPPVADADTGTGAEAGSVTATVGDTDTGSGADAATATAGASDSDTGSGADSGSPVIEAGDAGTGDDQSGSGGTLHFKGTPAYTLAAGQSAGTVTLNGTTAVAVSTGAVTSSSLPMLTVQPGTAPAGLPYVASISYGSGFTVRSTSAADTSVTVAWVLVEAV